MKPDYEIIDFEPIIDLLIADDSFYNQNCPCTNNGCGCTDSVCHPNEMNCSYR